MGGNCVAKGLYGTEALARAARDGARAGYLVKEAGPHAQVGPHSLAARGDRNPVAQGSSTRMTADVDYTIPVPVLGKLAEKVVLAQNEHEAEVTLANLKVRMEA